MSRIRSEIRKHIHAVKSIDTHSHIGAVISNGIFDNQRCSFEVGGGPEVSGIFDILCAPYTFWGLGEGGNPVWKKQICELAEKSRIAAFQRIEPYLRKWESTGHWQAVMTALEDIYGFTDAKITAENVDALDDKIKSSYGKKYYKHAASIIKKANIEKTLKMVQLPWLKQILDGNAEYDEAKIERGLVFPTVLIDSLVQPLSPDSNLSIGRKPKQIRFNAYCKSLGISPKSPEDYRSMISKFFHILDKSDVYGLKSGTAYANDLCFLPCSDAEFNKWASAYIRDPEKTMQNYDPADWRISLDYFMRRVLGEANQRGLPIQMHAGITSTAACDPNRLAESGCLTDFPDVKFVLLHAYPFCAEHAVLLRSYSNFYTDLSWLALTSAGVFEDALMHLIGFASDSKIVLGHDAATAEETYGSSVLTKRALENALTQKVESGYLRLSDAVEIPYRLLRNNAIDIWNLPAEKQMP